jgi:hypothetical protein
MSGQTTYQLTPNAAFAGMIADIRTTIVDSYSVEGADGIGFGLAVTYGALAPTFTSINKSCKVLSANSDVVIGFTAQQHTEQGYPFSASSGKYSLNETANIVTFGKIWIQTNASVVAGAPVYIVYTGADAGKARGDNSSAILIPGAVFGSSCSGAGVALVNFNFPASAANGITGATGSQGATGLQGATGV